MEKDNQELLNEINERLIRIEKNQIVGRKIRICVLCVFILFIVISALIIIPKVNATLADYNSLVAEAQEMLGKIDPADIDSVAEKLEILSKYDPDKLQKLVDAMGAIDFDRFTETFTTIQNFINYFK